MESLQVLLCQGEFIEGYGKEIVNWHIFIVLDDISKYEDDSQILVNLKMDISNQPSIIEVTQLLNCSDIQIGSPNLLPLKGELFLKGSREDTILVGSEMNLYYVKKV